MMTRLKGAAKRFFNFVPFALLFGGIVLMFLGWWAVGIAVSLAGFVAALLEDQFGSTARAFRKVQGDFLQRVREAAGKGTTLVRRGETSLSRFKSDLAAFLDVPVDSLQDEVLLTPNGECGPVYDFFVWEMECDLDTFGRCLHSVGCQREYITVESAFKIYRCLLKSSNRNVVPTRPASDRGWQRREEIVLKDVDREFVEKAIRQLDLLVYAARACSSGTMPLPIALDRIEALLDVLKELGVSTGVMQIQCSVLGRIYDEALYRERYPKLDQKELARIWQCCEAVIHHAEKIRKSLPPLDEID